MIAVTVPLRDNRQKLLVLDATSDTSEVAMYILDLYYVLATCVMSYLLLRIVMEALPCGFDHHTVFPLSGELQGMAFRKLRLEDKGRFSSLEAALSLLHSRRI